jgi:nucleoside-diphosphate-sugar epimerase/dTDP-4-dehydrorhamnose 3,5-epimerase-like enzyme
MSKRILLIGYGYIGNVLYDVLNKYYAIDILDNNLYNLIQNGNYINCDIRNIQVLENYIKKYDVIISLASIVGDAGCIENKELALDINYFGFKNIVDLVLKYDKFLVHLSTCSIYGKAETIINEETEASPIDYYGMLKLSQEKLIKTTLKNYLILRLGTVFGLSPRMRYDLVINTFIASGLNGKDLTVYGGDQKRPFLNIKDVCLAISYLLQNNKIGVFNVKGENYTMLEAANLIAKELNVKVNVIPDMIDKRSYIVDDTKLLATGFKYKFNIIDAINEIKTDLSVKNYKDDIYYNVALVRNIHRLIEPTLIKGDIFADIRGYLISVNDFHFNNIKRFYVIRNHDCEIIRAFHYHRNECKYLYCGSGSALIIIGKSNDGKNIDGLSVKKFILAAVRPAILCIPNMYANGIRMLEPNTSLTIYSTATLEESKKDDLRMPHDILGENIWFDNCY